MSYAMVDGVKKEYRRGWTMSEYTPFARHLTKGSNPDNEPVLGNYVVDYMNTQELRDALHIPSELPAFEQCLEEIDYHVQREGSQWIYPIMKGAGIKMLFFSGDTDGAVPTNGSISWIRSLKWPVTKKWRQWKIKGQVAGYVENMEGLDFATIKGVGHMAPQWARE